MEMDVKSRSFGIELSKQILDLERLLSQCYSMSEITNTYIIIVSYNTFITCFIMFGTRDVLS